MAPAVLHQLTHTGQVQLEVHGARAAVAQQVQLRWGRALADGRGVQREHAGRGRQQQPLHGGHHGAPLQLQPQPLAVRDAQEQGVVVEALELRLVREGNQRALARRQQPVARPHGEDGVLLDEVARLLVVVARPPRLHPVLLLQVGVVVAVQLPVRGHRRGVGHLQAHHHARRPRRVAAKVQREGAQRAARGHRGQRALVLHPEQLQLQRGHILGELVVHLLQVHHVPRHLLAHALAKHVGEAQRGERGAGADVAHRGDDRGRGHRPAGLRQQRGRHRRG
mmetsp:Transcript_36197/g.91429  ORF Transcript_36197/g.91429 Transcript_36197/m.91429 type:complete len:280 (-) Transcript_36197:35-874(-)